MQTKLNLSTGKITNFTQEELAQREIERQLAEEQAVLDGLLPTNEEIELAERQIDLINDLTELGVI